MSEETPILTPEELAAETELTIEDFYQAEIDGEKLREEEKELLPPVSTWTTVPGQFNYRLKNDKTGRPIANFFGKVTRINEAGKEETATMRYRISHVRKNKLDFETKVDTGKPDMAYKLYLQAAKAYRTAANQEPPNAGAVVQYLQDYAHRVRNFHTPEGESMVVAISPVRPQE